MTDDNPYTPKIHKLKIEFMFPTVSTYSSGRNDHNIVVSFGFQHHNSIYLLEESILVMVDFVARGHSEYPGYKRSFLNHAKYINDITYRGTTLKLFWERLIHALETTEEENNNEI